MAWNRRWTAAGSALLFLLLGCSAEPTSSERGLAGAANSWNLVVVSIDTLRADRLNSWGYEGAETSPAIDSLAASGVRFQSAQSPRALTWPALASVLTGLYPSGHGLIANGYSFGEDEVTLPKLLSARGYQTGAFLSNMCQANHQGWGELFCAGGVDKRVNRRALQWLDGIEPERPFFLWAHYFGAHAPYYNGGDLAATALDPGYEGELGPKKWRLDRVMTDGLSLSQEDIRHLDALYDAAVIGVDRFVAELIEGLERRVDLDRTILVVLADHGEDLYDHNGYLYHACSVYQSSLHVPLVIVAPGLAPAGAVVDQTVELVDVLPTLLELLGVEAPGCFDGSSLVGYLERPERSTGGKPALGEYGDTRIRTFLDGHWKLVHNPDHLLPKCFPGGAPDLYPIDALELYDLESDPGELSNLATEKSDLAAGLLARLEAREASRCRPAAPRTQEIPEELKKQLEALGYVAQ